MSIRNSVGDLVSGIPGTLSHEGPTRVLTALIDSVDETYNQFGRVFTYKADGVVKAGGTGVIAGLLVHPHGRAVDVPYLKNGVVGEFAEMAEAFVAIKKTDATDPAVGKKVYYNTTTGELQTGSTGGAEYPEAVITRHAPSSLKDNVALAMVALNGPFPKAE